MKWSGREDRADTIQLIGWIPQGSVVSISSSTGSADWNPRRSGIGRNFRTMLGVTP